MFGVPYTAKEHMHDTSAYYTKTDSDSDYVYTSTLDPVSTALDLIDSVNGDIKNERDNLEEGHEVIVFYSGTWCISLPIRMDKLRLRYVNNQN